MNGLQIQCRPPAPWPRHAEREPPAAGRLFGAWCSDSSSMKNLNGPLGRSPNMGESVSGVACSGVPGADIAIIGFSTCCPFRSSMVGGAGEFAEWLKGASRSGRARRSDSKLALLLILLMGVALFNDIHAKR
jgi:hypothetical protein